MFVPLSTRALGSEIGVQSSSPSEGASSGVRSRLGDASAKATEFEAILLGQWLQGSESAFGSVPGGEDDEDAGADQLKSFAFQHLASGLAEKGGIGIAKLVNQAISSDLKALSTSGVGQSGVEVQGQATAPRILKCGTEHATGLNTKESQ